MAIITAPATTGGLPTASDTYYYDLFTGTWNPTTNQVTWRYPNSGDWPSRLTRRHSRRRTHLRTRAPRTPLYFAPYFQPILNLMSTETQCFGHGPGLNLFGPDNADYIAEATLEFSSGEFAQEATVADLVEAYKMAHG